MTKEYSLGPGKLYIAGGRVPERELAASGICAGTTDGGCVLTYEYKLCELYDTAGNPAADVRYGERMRVRGKLCRVTGEALPLLSGKCGDGGRISILLVCTLPDGDALRLYARGGFSAGAKIHVGLGGALEFEMSFGRGMSYPKFVLSEENAIIGGDQDAGIA